MEMVTWRLVQRLVQGGRDERGATLVEYALMITLLAVVCIVAVSILGSNTSHTSSQVGSALQ